MPISRALFTIGFCVAVAACTQRNSNPAREDVEIAAGPPVDAAAVTAVTEAVQARLDQLPGQIQATMAAWPSAGFAYADIPAAVDWWFWNRKLMDVSGVDNADRPLMALTPLAARLVAAPASWVIARPTLDPTSRCEGSGLTATRCELKIVYALAPTSSGRIALGQTPVLPSLQTQATAIGQRGDWTVESLSFSGEETPEAYLTRFMSPPQADAETARVRMEDEIRTRASSRAGGLVAENMTTTEDTEP